MFATEIGTYEYTDANSGLNGSFTVTGTSTGVDQNETIKGALSIYPNPSTVEELNVKYSIPSGKGNIYLTDISGRQVQQVTITNSSGTVQLDQDLSSGTYFYSLFSEGVLIETKKVIIK